MRASKILRIAITSGDADGIGMEVATKALRFLPRIPRVQFLLWRSPDTLARELGRLQGRYRRCTVKTWSEALAQKSDSSVIIDINSRLSPAKWVDISVRSALKGEVDALVTGPLSKTEIRRSGMRDIGHTGILERVTGCQPLVPIFVGNKFNVALVTGHIGLKDVRASLTAARIESTVRAANRFCLLTARRGKNRIGILGLNPHAGENGVIDNFEKSILGPVLAKLRLQGLSIDGPLVPDAAFLPANWKRYSIFVALYHDQGLIPFKMVHRHHDGFQVTMGAPVVRTSVDHGTAKDLFSKNVSDYRSMLKAIKWALLAAKQNFRLGETHA